MLDLPRRDDLQRERRWQRNLNDNRIAFHALLEWCCGLVRYFVHARHAAVGHKTLLRDCHGRLRAFRGLQHLTSRREHPHGHDLACLRLHPFGSR